MMHGTNAGHRKQNRSFKPNTWTSQKSKKNHDKKQIRPETLPYEYKENHQELPDLLQQGSIVAVNRSRTFRRYSQIASLYYVQGYREGV